MLIDFTYILKWWFVIFLIGLSFLPLTSYLFKNFIDKAYSFSKVLGTLIITYSIFTISSLHLIKFETNNILLIWGLLTFGIWILLKKEVKTKQYFKLYLLQESIFFIALAIWAIVRGFQPDIHDLEKFMDFGFINSIMRTEYFPPKDMWFTPLAINYYYFGHLFTAVLTKINSIPSFISFNLMISTLFALTFTLSFSIAINLISKIKINSKFLIISGGFLTAFWVTLSGNLQTIYSLFSGYNGESPVPFWKLVLSLPNFPNAYWYPNATRFIYHTIHEFPSYSFVVADLHGHVLDIPVVLTIIAIIVNFMNEKAVTKKFIVSSSFLLSIAYMTNAWDGLIYLGVTALTILFFSDKKDNVFKPARALIDILKYFSPILILFILFSYLFNKNFSPFASGIGLNCSPDFLIKLNKIGPFIFENAKCEVSPVWQLGILYGFFIFIFLAFILFTRKRSLNISDKAVLLLSPVSFILIFIPEFFYLKDIYSGYFRANTMFKLTYQAFIMLSISCSYFIIRIITSIKEFKNIKSRISFYLFIALTTILFLLVSIYPYFSIPSGYGELKRYKGIDGLKYLKDIKPYDYDAINWINRYISGQPVILEAQGDSYTDYARISSNTGLPTVLGWTVHEWLWRGSYDIPSSRFADIKYIYEGERLDTTKDLIKKYGIRYIYIGVLEQEKYKINNEKIASLGKVIYFNPGVKIFKLN